MCSRIQVESLIKGSLRKYSLPLSKFTLFCPEQIFINPSLDKKNYYHLLESHLDILSHQPDTLPISATRAKLFHIAIESALSVIFTAKLSLSCLKSKIIKDLCGIDKQRRGGLLINLALP